MPQFVNTAVDQEPIPERCESFGGGMDGFTRSTLLAPDQFQYGKNTIVPDNFQIRTRPGADTLSASIGGRIQGLLYFDTPSLEQLIAGSSTKLWQWNGTTWTEMTGFTLNDADLDFSAAQGVDKMLITDGAQELRTWDGTAWSDALGTGDTSPPKGATILCWHAGRMWAAGFGGSDAGKENDAIWGSALLQFGLGDWSKTDRNIRIGGGDGDPIRGLASLSSSADKGFTMVVGKANSIWLINTPPTATFTNFTANIGPEQITDGIGLVGKRAHCVNGNDWFFVSPDKTIRSLARMAAAASQYQISAPLSLPIQPYVDRINWSYANKIVMQSYRDLVLCSVPLDSATAPNTVFVYNRRLQRWIGIWTGWTANSFEVSRFNDVHRLVHGDANGKVKQFKDYADATADATYLDDNTNIPTELWTRAFLFGEPLNDKQAFHAEVRFAQSNCNAVNVTLNCDDVDLKTWTETIVPEGPDLPISLPFNLESEGNIPRRKGLRAVTPFNECYLKLASTSGWWTVRNISMTAFLNMLRIT